MLARIISKENRNWDNSNEKYEQRRNRKPALLNTNQKSYFTKSLFTIKIIFPNKKEGEIQNDPAFT